MANRKRNDRKGYDNGGVGGGSLASPRARALLRALVRAQAETNRRQAETNRILARMEKRQAERNRRLARMGKKGRRGFGKLGLTKLRRIVKD